MWIIKYLIIKVYVGQWKIKKCVSIDNLPNHQINFLNMTKLVYVQCAINIIILL